MTEDIKKGKRSFKIYKTFKDYMDIIKKRKKFERNKKKCVTLIDKNFKLPAKLRGVEMKIPVIQETLVTQKFGDPSKY